MKTLLLFACLLLPLLTLSQDLPPAQAPAYSALDAKNGFRGYKFGTPLSEAPQMQKFGKRYVDQMELRRIGQVDLSRLDFYFFADRLCSVVLITEASPLIEGVFKQLVAEYGQPQVLGDNQWIWAGQRVTMVYTQIMLTANGGYIGVPLKAARITIDTNEAYARRLVEERPKGFKPNGSGL